MKKTYNNTPKVSSALTSVDLFQEPRPLIIGERLNSQGSKKAKKMVLENDFDGLIDVARAQLEDGAHCIDVCVATTERSDELEFMQKLVKFKTSVGALISLLCVVMTITVNNRSI